MNLSYIKSSFIILSILIGLNAKSQTTPLPFFEIITDTLDVQFPSLAMAEMLEDKEGKWLISDVIASPVSDYFHAKSSPQTKIDTNDVHIYWHRYNVRNAMDRVAKICVSSNCDNYDVYLFRNGGSMQHFQTGNSVNPKNKDGFKIAGPGAIPIEVAPGEEVTIYDRRFRKDATNFTTTVRLLSTEKYIQSEYYDRVERGIVIYQGMHLQESFILGMILLSIFLNLFFYRIVNEKVYLHFSLFLLFLGINRIWNLCYSYFEWEQAQLVYYIRYLAYAWAFIPYFLVQFFRTFLKTKNDFPRWDKILIGLALLNLLLNLVQLIAEFLFPDFLTAMNGISSEISFMFIPLSIIITLLLYSRKNDTSIRYLVIGSFPFLCLYVLTSLSEAFGLESSFIDDHILAHFRLIEVISLSWLILSFTVILMMRFDMLRKDNTKKQLDNERLVIEKEIEKNELIQKQKVQLEIEVAERTSELKQSIEDLKATQSQLIQSEKMASLGELTAGIAHEIQNPLNFVNNFSEINQELLLELKEEIDKGNLDEVKQLADDVIDNAEKINHHGKRADAIVKGMLQHSRTSSGVKESTDINALADEYLRLAYHGLRAKDKSFNATMKTDFDESIGKISIVPQDIGRVILNLITNAFHAVDERKKNEQSDYTPLVTVTTRKNPSSIEVIIQDNGNGIPAQFIDKIFQPFFTTKPTGKGTGLGLSLSYDIMKAHGGELKVETKEGEGTVFSVLLPVDPKH
jgi:two-component system NtrC family sensor kinase